MVKRLCKRAFDSLFVVFKWKNKIMDLLREMCQMRYNFTDLTLLTIPKLNSSLEDESQLTPLGFQLRSEAECD